MKTVKQEFDFLKNDIFNLCQGKRTVQRWNALREAVKTSVSVEAINMLDSSGFIDEWLKG